MAHEIEQLAGGKAAFVSARQPAWHQLGEVTEACMTATEIMAMALPPPPLQVRVNEVCWASGPTLWLPLVLFEPLQPPLAVQPVAFCDDQLRDRKSVV